MNTTLRTIQKVVFLEKTTNLVLNVTENVVLGLAQANWGPETKADYDKFFADGEALNAFIPMDLSEYNAINTNAYLTSDLYTYPDGATEKCVRYNTEVYDVIEYDGVNDPVNDPQIGSTYDEAKNAFIPHQCHEGYVLNEDTWEWEPDPNITYDIDGCECTYDAINKQWVHVSH